MSSYTPESLDKFIDFCQQYITGKEIKEAQIFLDRFFQAFGYQGVLEADDDILEKLLQLNLELAEKESQGIAIIGPLSPI